VDEIIVKFMGSAIFRQYTPKKRKPFDIKIYGVFDESGYIYDTRVCLVKDFCSATDDMTATHVAVRNLTCRVEGLGHKIFMNSFFSSPRLFDDLERHKKIHAVQYGPIEKTCPLTLDQKN